MPRERATSTIPDRADAGRLRRARLGRRIFLSAVALLVLTGLSGFLGVRTGTAAAESDGVRLAVSFPSVTRPGLAASWRVEVVAPGGFSGPVQIAAEPGYFDMFDTNDLDPVPSGVVQSDEAIVWTFDPPDGEILLVSYDARIEPGVQWGRRGRTWIAGGPGAGLGVSYRTWVMP